jgi:hypothetical protein
VNPASGVIVNWNNKPAAGRPATSASSGASSTRVLGLKDGIEALRAGRPFTTASVGGIAPRRDRRCLRVARRST